MVILIHVGCCGWAVKGGMQAYFDSFGLVELQSTFYRLPRLKTAARWRRLAPDDFIFTLKAWQVITHPYTSPTWRRGNFEVDVSVRDRYGFLRPSEENFEAWRKTLEVCEVLGAAVCVFQTPPSFGFSGEHVRFVSDFFSHINGSHVILAWEPRGSWNRHLDVVRDLCLSLGLVHVVDLFKRDPVSEGDICYFRLHGRGPGEVNNRYHYSAEDLSYLLNRISELISVGFDTIYVLFNNLFMAEDALRFKSLLSGSSL